MAAVRVLLLALLLAWRAGPAAAQRAPLRVVGDTAQPAVRVLSAILERGNYWLIDRDTLLPAGFSTDGDLLVVQADVRLEGRVQGAVAVVDGALFVRPRAVVGGPIASIQGEVFVSGLASAGERFELPATVQTRVARDAGGTVEVSVVPPPAPRVLRLPGILGLRELGYDRVNGATVGWGPRLDLGRLREGTSLGAVGRYRSARGAFDGQVGLELPLGGGVWAVGGAGRTVRTNEGWARGDLANSLSALFARSDVRDYYRSDFATLALERRPGEPLTEGRGFVGPHLGVLASRDRSLSADHPWTLFGDEAWRPNPPVAEGDLVSLVGGSRLQWRGASTALAADVTVEWAPAAWSDFDFTQLRVDGRWEMTALFGHSISVYAHLLEPLGSRGAPPQRWSFLGGPATLPTFATGALRGDHLAFVSSAYRVPVPAVTLPLLGSPALLASHAVGTAWATGEPSPRWEQNLGLGLAFPLFSVSAFVDPAAETLRSELAVGLTLPGM